MACEYLVASSNEMYLSLTKWPEPTLDDLAYAATRGCAALSTLASDQEFKGQVKELAERRRTNQAAFDFMTGRHLASTADALEQLTFFLKIEKDLLIANGMAQSLVEHLFNQALTSIQNVQDFGRNVDSLFEALDSGKYIACNLAATLNQQRSQYENKANTTDLLLKITNVVGGSAIIVINVAAAAVLTPAGADCLWGFRCCTCRYNAPPSGYLDQDSTNCLNKGRDTNT